MEYVTGTSKDICPKLNIFFSIDTILSIFPISESNNFISPLHVPNPQVMIESLLSVTWRNPVFCLQNVSNYVPLHILLYFNVGYHYFLYKLLWMQWFLNYLFLTELLEFGRCLIHSKHLIHVCWMNDGWLNFFYHIWRTSHSLSLWIMGVSALSVFPLSPTVI